MKPQYQHLKLIIETPTQEAWDKVTEFFGIKWNEADKWDKYKQVTNIALNDIYTAVGYCERDWYKNNRDKNISEIYSKRDFLTYPQFCERFLNQNNSLEHDTGTQLANLFERIDELFAPYTNGKIYPEATVLRKQIEQKLLEVTRNSEPLSFGEHKPSDMVTIYDRIPTVNEDVLINE